MIIGAAGDAAASWASEAVADSMATDMVGAAKQVEREALRIALLAAKEVGNTIARATREAEGVVHAELDSRAAEVKAGLIGVAALLQSAREAEETAAKAATQLEISYREALAAWIEENGEDGAPDDGDVNVPDALDATDFDAQADKDLEECRLDLGEDGEMGATRPAGGGGMGATRPAGAGRCWASAEETASGGEPQGESPPWARWASPAVREALAAARASALEAKGVRDRAWAVAERAVLYSQRALELSVAGLREAGTARWAQVSAAAAMASKCGIERVWLVAANAARGTEGQLGDGSPSQAAAAVDVLPRWVGSLASGNPAGEAPQEGQSMEAAAPVEGREALVQVDQEVCKAALQALRSAAETAALAAKERVRGAVERATVSLLATQKKLARLQAADGAARARAQEASSATHQLQAAVECALAGPLAVAARAERDDRLAGCQTVRYADAVATLASREAVEALAAAVDACAREVQAVQADAVALREKAREAAAVAAQAAREAEAAAARAADAREAAEMATREAEAAHIQAASAIEEAVEMAEAALREATTRAEAEAVQRAKLQAASTSREVVAAAEAAAECALAAAGCEHMSLCQAADTEELLSSNGQHQIGIQIYCPTQTPGKTGSLDVEHCGAATAALAAAAARTVGAKSALLARDISRVVVRQARAKAAAAYRAGVREVLAVRISATAKAAAAAAAWRAESARDSEARAAEAEAVLEEGVLVAERALLTALGKESCGAAVSRTVARRAVGRAFASLFPDFFAPLWTAREEGRGPEALGPLEMPCVFCFEGFDWEGSPARRPVLTPCCRRRLCAGCAGLYAARAAQGEGGGGGCCCPFAHHGCAGPAELLAWRFCALDEDLSLRWKLARALGFDFQAD